MENTEKNNILGGTTAAARRRRTPPHAAARRRRTPPPLAAAAAQIGIYKDYITKILFSFFHCIVHYVESLIKKNNAQTMTNRR